MVNSVFTKVSAKGTFIILSSVLIVFVVIISVNISTDKPFYILDKRFGFGVSASEELLKQKSNYDEKIKGYALETEKLKTEISQFEKEINELTKFKLLHIHKTSEPVKYSRSKLVYPEENFTDSESGVAFSLRGATKLNGVWRIAVTLFIPESGQFKRSIKISDTWDFPYNDKKYHLSFSEFDPEELTVLLKIIEI